MENYPEHDRLIIVYYRDGWLLPEVARYWVLDGFSMFVSADSNYEKYMETNGDTYDYAPLQWEVCKWQYLPDNGWIDI